MVDLNGIREYSDNPEQTLITALQTWAASVVDNESFHADLHGGNILVRRRENRVHRFWHCWKDSNTTWNALDALLGSFAIKDYQGVASAGVYRGD